jgi:teichuronic acid biosynthesis glycosyltransferase TuaC
MRLAYLIARYGTEFPANEIHLELCKALSEKGTQVTVLAFSVSGYTGEVPTVRLKPPARPWAPLARVVAGWTTGYPQLFGMASAMSLELAFKSFDLVHVEGIFPAGSVLWLSQRGNGPPYVVSLQGTDVIRRPDLALDRLERPAIRWLANRVLRAARAVRANSPLTARLVKAVTGETEIRVVPRNIAARYFAYSPEQAADLKVSARRALAEKLSIGPEPLVMAFGRMHPCKGFDLLLEASARLQSQGVVHRLVLAGPDSPEVDRRGSFRRRLLALANRLSFAAPPIFLEAVQEEEMPSYYAAAHVVAVPSLLEGFNKVAVEAAALGTPVVISTGAGAHSYFSQHRAGLVVPAGDVAALADAIAHILSEPSDAEEMAHRGYAMARLFTAQQVAGQLLELFSLIHQ